jgi:cytochrome c
MRKSILTLLVALMGLSFANSSHAYKIKNTKEHKAKAKKILAKQKCLTCHNEKKKVVGPAYRDVAKKYLEQYWKDEAALIATLKEKVKKGGSGNWGKAVMTPNTGISDEELDVVLQYILNLKFKGRKKLEKPLKKAAKS